VYVAREAEQEAQADVNRAKGRAEAQKLLAETLKAEGGGLVLQKEAIEAWRSGGAQMPNVLVMGEGSHSNVPFIFNLKNIPDKS
jgi:regulator of protease activity HflC (stomatin/prohibitin superfamily)